MYTVSFSGLLRQPQLIIVQRLVKLLPFLFNMNTLVSDQSSPMTYTNKFCVAILAVFATYNPSEAALTVLRWWVIFGGANFVRNRRRPSELNFVVLNFETATQSRSVVLH